MAQGNKAELRIRELFFIPRLLWIADFLQGCGRAAADKRGEPQEGVKKVLKKDNRLPSRNLEIGCFFGIIDI